MVVQVGMILGQGFASSFHETRRTKPPKTERKKKRAAPIKSKPLCFRVQGALFSSRALPREGRPHGGSHKRLPAGNRVTRRDYPARSQAFFRGGFEKLPYFLPYRPRDLFDFLIGLRFEFEGLVLELQLAF